MFAVEPWKLNLKYALLVPCLYLAVQDTPLLLWMSSIFKTHIFMFQIYLSPPLLFLIFLDILSYLFMSNVDKCLQQLTVLAVCLEHADRRMDSRRVYHRSGSWSVHRRLWCCVFWFHVECSVTTVNLRSKHLLSSLKEQDTNFSEVVF